MQTWTIYDLELGLLHRYTIPTEELEFAVRSHAEDQFLWKMGLPSAFSWMKEHWKAEAWIANALRAVSSMRGMFQRFKKEGKL